MKYLKRLLCLIMIFPVVFCLTACGKKKKKDEDLTPETKALSTNEILDIVFDKFNEESKNEILLTHSYSEKEGDVYFYPSFGDYVYNSIKLLSEISKEKNLSENVWCYSDEFDAENLKVNKISKFKIESSTINDVTSIDIYMKFNVKNTNLQTNLKTFDMLNYSIKYYQLTGGVSMDCFIEKSRNYVDNYVVDSTSECFVVKYKPGEILAISFTRNWDIDDILDVMQINSGSISDFHYFRFDLNDNEEILNFNGFTDPDGFDYNSVQQQAQSCLISLSEINEFIDDAEVGETKIESISSEIITLISNIKVVKV